MSRGNQKVVCEMCKEVVRGRKKEENGEEEEELMKEQTEVRVADGRRQSKE